MDDQVAQRLAELADVLDGTASRLSALGAEYEWSPTTDSAAATEENEASWCDAGTGLAEMARSIAGITAIAATDHLVALHTLLTGEGQTLLGAHILARPAMEAAARTWWLLEPGLGSHHRFARVTAWRVQSLRQTVKVMTGLAPEAAVDAQKARLQSVLDHAKAHGVPAQIEAGKVVGVTTTVPGAGDLVSTVMDEWSFDAGGSVYALLSGVLHARPFALMEFFEQDGETQGGIGSLVPRTSLAAINQAVFLATTSHLSMTCRLLEFYGWPHHDWDAWRTEAVSTLLAPLPREP